MILCGGSNSRPSVCCPEEIVKSNYDSIYELLLLSLALANKDVYNVATRIYYHENTRKLDWSRFHCSVPAKVACPHSIRPTPILVWYLPRAVAHHPTKLEINIEVCRSDDGFPKLFCDWVITKPYNYPH